LIGGVIGVLVYDVFIGDVLHVRAGQEPPGRTQSDVEVGHI
jgi:glycerol uptake facilitator protein